MALFTDGAIASIEDLRGHDTQLLNVATVEGIFMVHPERNANCRFAGAVMGSDDPLLSTYS